MGKYGTNTVCDDVRYCTNADRRLPPPSCFGEDTIQRQLDYILDCPCPVPKKQLQVSRVYQRLHTTFLPALLYVPAYYYPIHTPCVSRCPDYAGTCTHCADDQEPPECELYKKAGQAEHLDKKLTSSSKLSKEPEKQVEPQPRPRDNWKCDFCGPECFCSGLQN